MREIKFRALINVGGERAKDKIVNVEGILFEKDDLKIAYRIGDGSLRWQRPKAIIEYTGLKDKNGKEIYEGDIADIFIDPVAPVKIDEIKKIPVIDKTELWMVVHHIKIIGNIYENPELLND